jgi:hypothetical protein
MRILAVILLVGAVAHAEPKPSPWPEPSERKWHLYIEGVTDFPLYAGVQLTLQLPHRIRLSTSFGDMPGVYLDTINATAVALGAYNQNIANLIEETLDRAFTWRLHIGWQPFKHRGGYIEGGFGTLETHGNLGITSVLEAATGIMAPQELRIGFGFRLDAVVETVGIEAGWMWYPWRDLTVRFAIGFHWAVGAQVTVRPNFTTSLQNVFTRLVGDFAEQMITNYLYIPTVGLAIGWRLY